MRCFYCARQERASGDGVAVAICKRCGSGICLEHLCEVRRDRHAGTLGQAPGQSVELLCLACAGIAPAETRRPAPTGHLAGSDSEWGASISSLSSSTRAEGESAWADSAGVVVAAEAYLERLRAPTRPNTRGAPAATPDAALARWRWGAPSQWWRRHGRRWFASSRQRITSRMSASQSPQR